MKFRKLLKPVVVGLAALSLTALAGATTIDQADAFYTFWKTVDGWTSGGLGVGLATTMLLMGGFIGAAKNSPMPALSGVAGAAFLHWGPGVIQTIMLNGALV
jgi:conjugal transfer pilus assembly protein TraA